MRLLEVALFWGLLSMLVFVWQSEAYGAEEAPKPSLPPVALTVPADPVPLLLQQLRDKDANRRWMAAAALGEYPDARAVSPLLRCLDDRSPQVRNASISTLGKIGDPRAVAPLCALLRRSSDADTQAVICTALAGLKAPGEKALRNLLNDRAPAVRLEAAFALQQGGHDQLAIIRPALTHADTRLRLRAITVVAAVKDQPALPQLLILAQDDNAAVCEAALHALCTLYPAAAPEQQQAINHALVTALSNEHLRVASLAATQLGQITPPGLPDAVLPLLKQPNVKNTGVIIDLLTRSNDARVSEALLAFAMDDTAPGSTAARIALVNRAADLPPATRAKLIEELAKGFTRDTTRAATATLLGRIDDPLAVEALFTALREVEKPGGRAITEALGKNGKPACERLLTLMQDPDPRLHWLAAHALTGLKDVRAVPALIKALHEDTMLQIDGGRAWTSSEAAGGLRAIGAPAIDALLPLSHDADKDVRGQAMMVIGESDDPRGQAVLTAALQETDPRTLEMAVYFAGERKDPGLIPTLQAIVRDHAAQAEKDEEWGWVVSSVAWSLPNFGPQGVDALLEIYAPSSVKIQQAMSGALARMGGVDAHLRLLALLHDPSPAARRGAVLALGVTDDPEANTAIYPLLKDQDTGVRTAAVMALRGSADPHTWDHLAPLVTDPDPAIRQQAITALLHWGRFTPAALTDPAAEVRLGVAATLAEVKDMRRLPDLLTLQHDSDPKVRTQVASTLGAYAAPPFRLFQPLVVEPLIAALADSDAGVRKAAVDALKTVTKEDFGESGDKWREWWGTRPHELPAAPAMPVVSNPHAGEAARTFLRWADTQLNGMETEMPVMTATAEKAARLFVREGYTVTGLGDNAFISELLGRAGGLMTFGFANRYRATPAKTVVLFAPNEETLARDVEIARRLHDDGCYLIAFGGSEMLARAQQFGVKFDDMIDTHAMENGALFPARDGSVAVGTNEYAGVIAGWAWTAEFVAACTRLGKMPTIYKAYAVPGGKARAFKLTGLSMHEGTPLRLPAGVPGRLFLAEMRTELNAIAQQEMGKITTLANRTVAARRAGHAGYVFGYTHMIHGAMDPGQTPLYCVKSFFTLANTNNDWINLRTDVELMPGDVFLCITQKQTCHGGEFVNFDQRARRAGATLAWCFGAIDPLENATVPRNEPLIDQHWRGGDAVVPLPGYDVDLVPTSGLTGQAVLLMVSAEMWQLETAGK